MIYANEIDKHAAHWLSKLPLSIDRVDDRSISDVKGGDLDGYKQCHFFAGIGGWPLALEMAGWPIDAPVWTGSCPCQPFSAAGKRKGVKDERHLWPEFRRLIDDCRPSTIFGEQVASKDGRHWLSDVRADLEALGYAVGAADLSAAGAGAPHIRQRLFWVAHRGSARLEKRQEQSARQEHQAAQRGGDAVCGMADAGREQRERREDKQRSDRKDPAKRGEEGIYDQQCSGNGRLGNAEGIGSSGRLRCESIQSTGNGSSLSERSDHWDDVEFVPCRDRKARPAKPGVRLLAHGIPGRVAQLRGLGNAIVPQVAAIFIEAFMESVEVA